MALEISSARLLAPYFGTSIFVWTNIIGVVLGALSLGYFLGGKLSENNASLDRLLRLTGLTGLLVLAVPWLVHPLAQSLLSHKVFDAGTGFVTVGSLAAITALFGLPLMLLGITSPYLIKLSSQHTEHIGDIAGRLFAVSTLGSLAGTFLPTLVLIPNFGTRNTILGCGLLLGFVGLFGFKKLIQKIVAAMAALALLLMPSADTATATQLTVLHSEESPYQRVRITEAGDGTRYLQFDAGFGVQSVYNPKTVLTGFHYYDYYNVLPILVGKQEQKVLIIGLAGGTIARQLNFFYGEAVEIHGVEMDPAVIKVSKKYLGLGDIPVKIINQDGRIFLAQTNETYDIIIVDAYHNEFEIPWTLTTQEFWRDAKSHLSPDGTVAMNIATSTTKKELLNAFIRTSSTVFEDAYVTPTSSERLPVGNYMITLSNRPLNFQAAELDTAHTDLTEIVGSLKERTFKAQPKPDALLLTDDKAPVDLLTARTLWPDLNILMK